MKFNKDEMKMPEEKFGPVTTAEKGSSFGVILGVLITLLIIILAGLYVWGKMLSEQIVPPNPTPEVERPTAEENNEPESTNAEAEVETLDALSNSDELSAIEADLKATDATNMDAEIPAVEAELPQ